MATMVTTPDAVPRSARRPLRITWRLCLSLSLTGLFLAWESWKRWPSSGFMQAILCVAFALAQAALFRRYWTGLAGPVLFYDMVRVSRRGRYVVLRIVYGALLFSSLGAIAQRWLEHVQIPTENELARVANCCLSIVVALQFIAVITLMPAYAAGAITEERERRTLEYLLATDLADREIVLGKFLSRLANMTMLLLVGLPVVSLLQLLGGIDLGLLLLAFAATVLFMLSVAALSLFCSVHALRTRGAVVEAYVLLAAYLLVLPAFSEVLRITATGSRGYEAPVLNALPWLNAGNPLYLFTGLVAPIFTGIGLRGTGLSSQLATSFARFAAFHAFVTIGCLWLAVRRLRRAPRSKTLIPAKRRSSPGRSRHVWGPPVLWKEMQIRGWPRVKGAQRIYLGALFALTTLMSVTPLLAILAEDRRWRAEDANTMVRSYVSLLSCVLLIAVTLKSSAAIAGERTKQTLDALLATPLSTREILWGKWLGSILSARYIIIWLAAISVVGLTMQGLHPISVIWLLAAVVIYMAAAASMGLCASFVARSRVQAHLGAFAMVTCCSLAQAIVVMWVGSITFFDDLPQLDTPGQFLIFMPPVTVAYMAFSNQERGNPAQNLRLTLFLTMVSLALWFASAVCFYWLTSRSFRKQRTLHISSHAKLKHALSLTSSGNEVTSFE
jgi:ABC-type Na+ efflux pump permease subunit